MHPLKRQLAELGLHHHWDDVREAVRAAHEQASPATRAALDAHLRLAFEKARRLGDADRAAPLSVDGATPALRDFLAAKGRLTELAADAGAVPPQKAVVHFTHAAPGDGTLRVDFTGDSARVLVDGNDVGSTPYEDTTDMGVYQVTLALAPGTFQPSGQEVEVYRNRTTTVRFHT
jgi:hypothetical protein